MVLIVFPPYWSTSIQSSFGLSRRQHPRQGTQWREIFRKWIPGSQSKNGKERQERMKSQSSLRYWRSHLGCLVLQRTMKMYFRIISWKCGTWGLSINCLCWYPCPSPVEGCLQGTSALLHFWASLGLIGGEHPSFAANFESEELNLCVLEHTWGHVHHSCSWSRVGWGSVVYNCKKSRHALISKVGHNYIVQAFVSKLMIGNRCSIKDFSWTPSLCTPHSHLDFFLEISQRNSLISEMNRLCSSSR